MNRTSEERVRRISVRSVPWAVLAFALLAGCTTGPSAPVADDTPTNGIDDGSVTTVDRYEGEWTIVGVAHDPDEVEPEVLTFVCPGSITLTVRTATNGTFEILAGSYVVLAEQDCTVGSTISGSLLDINVRQDGGVDFGLEVPGSDGNLFEDFLVGAGMEFESVYPYGCGDPQPDGSSGEAKDVVNHLDGTLLDNRLRAAASASMKCPGGDVVVVDEEEGGERVADDLTVQVKISIDLTRTP